MGSELEEKPGLDDTPPTCNTGAENTYTESLRACVDWVQATFLGKMELHNVFDILGIDSGNFKEMENGQFGYKKLLQFGHIKVYYDGNENMGIHIEMSGQACREYEQLVPNNWHTLFWAINRWGKFSRLDVAIDDFHGYFKIKHLKSMIKRGLCRSKFQKGREIQSFKLDDGEELGRTLYVGSASSMLQIRFYDKLAERIGAGKTIEDGLTHWTRTELQLRKERADQMARYIFENPDKPLGETIKGVLSHYINFLEKSDDPNKARWPVAPFWKKFLGDVEKLPLTNVAPDRTVEKVKVWIEEQVETGIAMMFLTEANPQEWIVQTVERGIERMSKLHHNMVDSFNKRRFQSADALAASKESIGTSIKTERMIREWISELPGLSP